MAPIFLVAFFIAAMCLLVLASKTARKALHHRTYARPHVGLRRRLLRRRMTAVWFRLTSQGKCRFADRISLGRGDTVTGHVMGAR